MANIDWDKELQPLLKKYQGSKHLLQYKNIYQLMVMVVLSAQDSEQNINRIAPLFFNTYPDMESLSKASPDDLIPFIDKVHNFSNKAKWLIKAAQQIKSDENIPLTMQALILIPGLGRKSANVIKREAGAPAEGVMVDLDVIRVSNRLGIANSGDPKLVEKDIMSQVPQKDWAEIGMAMSSLGREICRERKPKHHDCPIRNVCLYYSKTYK